MNEAKPELVYVLRSCRPDLKSRNDFVWPTSGPVECPDWDPKPECGHGLHGLLWGIGDWSLCHLSDPAAKWLVVAVAAGDVVEIEHKAKFPRGEVVYCGGLPGAQSLIAEKRLVYLASTSGNFAPASTSGNFAPASTSGEQAPASTSGYFAPASTSGNFAPASTSGRKAPASTSGEHSVACCLGSGGTAKCGPNGSLVLTYWDGKRFRHVVAYAGEDGIESGVWYDLGEDRKPRKAADQNPTGHD